MGRIKIFGGIIIFIFLFFFFLSENGLPHSAKQTKRSTVEIEYGYPDQSIFVATTNYRDKPDSPMLYLAEAIMKRAGLSWHARSYPTKRLFHNLKNGITNFSILVRASSLLECCIFSQNPVYSTDLNIYYIDGKPPVKSKEDLIGNRVITIRGYSYASLLKFISEPGNKIVNVVAGTHRAAFKMLNVNRGDYLIDYASAANDILSESPIQELKSVPIGQLDIFLVLSKAIPNAEELMIELERITETLNINELLRQR